MFVQRRLAGRAASPWSTSRARHCRGPDVLDARLGEDADSGPGHQLPHSHCRTAIAVVAMVGFCVHRDGKILTPLTLLDLCMVMVCVLDGVSDVVVDGWSWATPVKAYGQWILPYVAGRFAMRNSDDLKSLAPWVVGVLVALSLCGLLESVSGVNPIEFVFGNRPVDGFTRNASRLGLKRAFGNTMHPMFFGILLLVLIPWCWALIRLSISWSWRATGVAALLTATGGICSTVSRGPVFALAIALLVMVALRLEPFRWPMAIVTITAIVVLAVFPTQTLNLLEVAVHEEDRKTLVEVDGQAAEYSSAKSRLLIFSAYGDALRHAGLTGYGSKKTTGFPPNIPYLQNTRHTVDRLRNVDNAYVLFTLRFGYLGLFAFILLLLSAIFTAAKVSSDTDLKNLLAAICGSLVGLAAVLLSVWFCYDFGFTVIWTMGILSGNVILPDWTISNPMHVNGKARRDFLRHPDVRNFSANLWPCRNNLANSLTGGWNTGSCRKGSTAKNSSASIDS